MNKYLRVFFSFFFLYYSEISNGRKDNTEAVRGHSVEANPKEVGFHKKIKISYFIDSVFTYAQRLYFFVYIKNKMELFSVLHVTFICLCSCNV